MTEDREILFNRYADALKSMNIPWDAGLDRLPTKTLQEQVLYWEKRVRDKNRLPSNPLERDRCTHETNHGRIDLNIGTGGGTRVTRKQPT